VAVGGGDHSAALGDGNSERIIMPISNALASVAVRNLQSTIQWYEKLFGRPADSRPMSEVAEWKFEGGGWLQVYQNRDRAGTGSVTFAVSDLDEQIADLKKSGIEPGAPMKSPKVNVVMIKDPDGNSIAFAQALDRTMAH
jgi:predicted enzyme related to lactoylglutathione lyase